MWFWKGRFSVFLLLPILPHMPVLGSSYSAANKDMTAEMGTNGDTIICIKNVVEKGVIARYERFLLFLQYFQKQSVVDVLKRVSMELRVNTYILFLFFITVVCRWDMEKPYNLINVVISICF